MKYLYPELTLGRLCRLFGKSRQGYYHWKKRHNSNLLFNAVVVKLIKAIRQEMNNNRLGGKKLLQLVNEKLSLEGMKIGRDKLYAIMQENGLLVRQRKRKAKTTDSEHNLRRYCNLIKEKEITSPEEVWVSDITYLRVGSGFNYLSLITDAYSRKIMGYCLYHNLSSKGPEEALLMALGQRRYPKHSLIHHSDQGVQYCSYNYVTLLKTSGIRISMTNRGSPEENAIAERVNGILKDEYGLKKNQPSHEKAKQAVEEAIRSYNEQRPHTSLDMLTPEQAHNVKLEEELLKL